VGITYVQGTVTGTTGKHATVKFLVDSGATYSLLPKKVWRAIGLKPINSVTCILADGTEVERKVSECSLELPEHGERHTPVMLGEAGDEALLGVVTLEIFGLVLHPYTRKLQPMRMLLACRIGHGLSENYLNLR
jgi:aspartyl protease family protein